MAIAARLYRCTAAAFAMWSGGLLLGQGNGALLQRFAFPPQLRGAVDALGSRVVRSGNERVISVGVLSKGGSRAAVRITRQLPDKLRIDFGSNASRSVIMSGNSASASDQVSSDDLDMTESISDDSPESVLYDIQNGNHFRLLGQGFRADNGGTENYNGPWLDLFAITGVAKGRSSDSARRKLVVFDSAAKFLLYVRYTITRGSAPVVVQTEWSGWTYINGQAVPTAIVRRENASVVWSIWQNQTTIGPAQADGTFTVAASK